MSYSGHGLLDLLAYDKYLSGQLMDASLGNADLEKMIAGIKDHPKPPMKKSGRW